MAFVFILLQLSKASNILFVCSKGFTCLVVDCEQTFHEFRNLIISTSLSISLKIYAFFQLSRSSNILYSILKVSLAWLSIVYKHFTNFEIIDMDNYRKFLLMFAFLMKIALIICDGYEK